MKKINSVLVTAIGSMSAQTVLESLRSYPELKIYGCDIHPKEYLVIANRFDGFNKAPKASDKNYITEIVNLCKSFNIDLIIPLTDPEVDVLSNNRNTFEKEGILLAIQNVDAVSICRNKKVFYDKLKHLNVLKLIPTFDTKEILSQKIEFPIIAKPAKGRSSEGLYKVNDNELLNYITNNLDNYVFQQYIPGEIFTVDVIRDISGNIYSLARKEVIRTSNGAGLSVEIKFNSELFTLVNYLCTHLNIVGCINLEFIFDGSDYYLMDINPRFSAGIGFSKIAGYDFVRACFDVFSGKEIETITEIKKGIYGKGYTDYIITEI